MQTTVGVVALVSMVLLSKSSLSSLLLTLSLSLPLSRRCFGGRCLGARLERSGEEKLMLSWLFASPFYLPQGAPRGTPSLTLALGGFPSVPKCCRSLGTLST